MFLFFLFGWFLISLMIIASAIDPCCQSCQIVDSTIGMGHAAISDGARWILKQLSLRCRRIESSYCSQHGTHPWCSGLCSLPYRHGRLQQTVCIASAFEHTYSSTLSILEEEGEGGGVRDCFEGLCEDSWMFLNQRSLWKLWFELLSDSYRTLD